MTHHATTPSGKARRLFGRDVVVRYLGNHTKRWHVGGWNGPVFVDREPHGPHKYTAWEPGGGPTGIARMVAFADTLEQIAQRLTEQGWLREKEGAAS